MRGIWMALAILIILLTTAVASVSARQSAVPQTAQVRITKNGFEPSNLKLKVNVPARITFLRQTNDTCATSVVISEYKIKKDLPLNQPVVAEFTPAKTGKFSFVCGMQMLKGDLVVSEQ